MCNDFYLLFAYMFCLLDSTGAINVQQSPIAQFVKPGEGMKLTCQHDDSNYDRMYWYQQLNGQQALELVGFLYFEDVNQDKEYKGKFNLSGNAKSKGFLTISNMNAGDSGTYFCAANDARAATAPAKPSRDFSTPLAAFAHKVHTNAASPHDQPRQALTWRPVGPQSVRSSRRKFLALDRVVAETVDWGACSLLMQAAEQAFSDDAGAAAAAEPGLLDTPGRVRAQDVRRCHESSQPATPSADPQEDGLGVRGRAEELTGAVNVQQFPVAQFVKLGDDMELTCQHDDKSYNRMYWYQQLNGQQALELIPFLLNRRPNQPVEVANATIRTHTLTGFPPANTANCVHRNCIHSSHTEYLGAITVEQTPSSFFGNPRDDVQLICKHDGSNYQFMYWYQRVQGQQALELIGFLQYDIVNQDEKYKGKFNLSGHAKDKGSLDITSLSVQDSGTYFCAASYHSGGSCHLPLQKTSYLTTAVYTCLTSSVLATE
ncbi:uncharacterized protein LOC135256016 [Anguilla rostrata]|uniref:uncharacterized protein LOC135256016 n=1 Tax=Anguilla rostrata TaxID=7938 RepID=UPI0030D4835B